MIMKKIRVPILLIFIVCFFSTCRKKDDTGCPVCPSITSFSPTHGKKDDVITLNGVNFATHPDGLDLKASINGKNAILIPVSDDQVKIKVPDNCGSGTIRVYYDDELFGDAETPFTYAVGKVKTIAGKCGTAVNNNTDPLLAQFSATVKVFLDEPRGIIYVISDDSKTLSRISSAGVKTLISGSADLIRSGICDHSGNIFLAFEDHIARVDNAVSLTLTTVAGVAGTKAHADGQGANAKFNFINDIIIDEANNIYIAENTYIRKMNLATFTVSTIAGTGVVGFLDGPALSAKFSSVVSIDIDRANNIYIADWSNNRMRLLTPQGTVSTIAGNGTQAVSNGIGTAAQLQSPRSVVVDNNGSILYFSDSFTSFIRKIELSTSEVSYFTGDVSLTGNTDGSIETALFFQPRGFVYSRTSDEFYVADYFNCKVRKIFFE